MGVSIVPNGAKIISLGDILGLVIKDNSPASTSTLLTGIIDFWKLDEATAATRVGAVNANNLTDHASVVQGSGIVGSCASFTAASSMYLDKSTKQWGFSTAWSVSSWHKQSAGAINKGIWQFGADLATPSASAFKLESDYLYMANSAGTIKKYWNSFATSTNWIHTVLTWDGTTLLMYRDGADYGGSVTKTTDLAMVMADDTRPFFIGCSSNSGAGEYFDGLIDAVGLWSRALTSAEVTELYNLGNGKEYPFL